MMGSSGEFRGKVWSLKLVCVFVCVVLLFLKSASEPDRGGWGPGFWCEQYTHTHKPGGPSKLYTTGWHPCQMKAQKNKKHHTLSMTAGWMRGNRADVCAEDLASIRCHRMRPGITSLAPSSASWTRTATGDSCSHRHAALWVLFCCLAPGRKTGGVGWGDSGFIVFQGSE